jgi:dihydrolipoamide dehydrogenase
MSDFDVIVIGAGPAGEVLAGRTAAAGFSTAIVGERLVGTMWAESLYTSRRA